MRFQDEIRSTEELEKPSTTEVSAQEIDMAIMLIKRISHKFIPKEYKDTYVGELKKLIEQKAKGKKIVPKGKPVKTTSSKNLMLLLKKSIDRKAA